MAVEGAEVTRTYLELRDPGQLRGDPLLDSDGHVEQVVECPVSFFRFLYAEVGRAYHWVDRLPWSDDEIRTYLRRPGVSIHVLYVEGSPAGYFELVRSTGASTEIAYFGLLPEFLGRGLGKKLLTFAAEAAFRGGARRVWLHTCTLDDPAALPNYLARGFRPFKTESYLFRGPAEGIKNVV